MHETEVVRKRIFEAQWIIVVTIKVYYFEFDQFSVQQQLALMQILTLQISTR